jgi:capsular exopolysaccharide synthesis family protein
MQVQDDAGGSADLDLRHYVRVIGRRRWLILGVALLVGVASMGWAFTKEDRYHASADLLLLAPSDVEADAQQLSTEADRAIANEIEILGSEEMTEAVTELIGGDFPHVDADSKGDNDVVVLTSESTDPEAARDSVNAYAQAYERLRRQRTVAALREQLGGVQADRQAKREQLDNLVAPVTDLEQQIAATPVGPQRDALLAELSTRQDQISATRDAILGELGQFDQQVADLQRAMRNPSGGVQVLNRAGTPTEPYYPQPRKDLYVGLVVGLLLGLVVAFLWEQLDDRVRGRVDADRATGRLPIVGLVPKITGWRNRAEALLVVRDDPRSSAAEAYRSLVTSLEFLAPPDDGRVLLFTSPGASEGKSTTVANVGLAFAEAGHRTVIVDADLRRPRLHKFFDRPGTAGLSTVLNGTVDVATVVESVDDDHPLDLVPAGAIAPNPAELLRSAGTEAALAKLRETHDIVLVDCPPVLPVADALVLSRHVDVAILLAAADSTGKRKLARAVESLRQVAAPLEGLVLNGVSAGEGQEYGYYGDDESGGSKGKRRRRGRRAARA